MPAWRVRCDPQHFGGASSVADVTSERCPGGLAHASSACIWKLFWFVFEESYSNSVENIRLPFASSCNSPFAQFVLATETHAFFEVTIACSFSPNILMYMCEWRRLLKLSSVTGVSKPNNDTSLFALHSYSDFEIELAVSFAVPCSHSPGHRPAWLWHCTAC